MTRHETVASLPTDPEHLRLGPHDRDVGGVVATEHDRRGHIEEHLARIGLARWLRPRARPVDNARSNPASRIVRCGNSTSSSVLRGARVADPVWRIKSPWVNGCFDIARRFNPGDPVILGECNLTNPDESWVMRRVGFEYMEPLPF